MKENLDKQNTDFQQQQALEQEALQERMRSIKHTILILSGKGGVGKSTVAANLAFTLARDGKRVGLLDVDIHGPSIPKLMGIMGQVPQMGEKTITPVKVGERLLVMSMGSLLQHQDLAVIWRGPLKMGAIKQFLKDVEWGELDFLIIDSPPGTGDEPLSVAQLIPDLDGAILVTSPQDLSVLDVRKTVTFCRQLSMPVLGVVENMSGLVCPHCSKEIDVFKRGGGERMALEMNLPFLGRIPIDPQVVEASDAGVSFISAHPDSPTAEAFEKAVQTLLAGLDQAARSRPAAGREATEDEKNSEDPPAAGDSAEAGGQNSSEPDSPDAAGNLKIAVPTAEGKLTAHFGHCRQFAIVEVADGRVNKTTMVEPPPHEPGVLPEWLHRQGVGLIIAGGMGRRAQGHFADKGVEVITGAPSLRPAELVEQYLGGALQTGDNICDH
jgi:Mrp family chromosome partitioning ATPase/predicted Fe-Mo cluster-binding NifX family protein